MEKINNLQVIELSPSELRSIEGGSLPRAIAGFVIWVIDEWDDISAGYKQGYANATK